MDDIVHNRKILCIWILNKIFFLIFAIPWHIQAALDPVSLKLQFLLPCFAAGSSCGVDIAAAGEETG